MASVAFTAAVVQWMVRILLLCGPAKSALPRCRIRCCRSMGLICRLLHRCFVWEQRGRLPA